jgi:hypothetical protein
MLVRILGQSQAQKMKQILKGSDDGVEPSELLEFWTLSHIYLTTGADPDSEMLCSSFFRKPDNEQSPQIQ